MQNLTSHLPSFFHLPQFKDINGVRFTSREIDIIACLLSGRSQKTIAIFLAIAPRTVETHTRNIMLKIEGSSRESIINFVEKAGKSFLLRRHYQALLVQAEFEKRLKIISTLINGKTPTCHVFYEPEQENNIGSVAQHIKAHLCLCGIKTSITTRETQRPLSTSVHKGEFSLKEQTIYIASKKLIEQLETGKTNKLCSDLIWNKADNTQPIIFLLLDLDEENLLTTKESTINVVYINPHDPQSYYLSFFNLLNKVQPTIDLNDLIKGFQQQCSLIHEDSHKVSIKLDIDDPKENNPNKKLRSLRKLKELYLSLTSILTMVASMITIIIFISGFLLFKGKTEENIKRNYTIQKDQNEKIHEIRSDLFVPTENILLQRPELITQVEDRLKDQQGIKIVALVGVGGVGKTTVARQYAHAQKASVLWEINSETKENIINSVENLAYALSETEEEKKALKGLQDIKNTDERENKILLFVKENLKKRTDWFLIYDNVKKFGDIQKYFPNDMNTWGQGRVIVTTRDGNIKNNSHINHVLFIGELDPRERLELFTKIIYNGEGSQITAAQQEQINQFLNEIPSFPLDVSVAAYYIKATNISFKKYLELLNEDNDDFEDTQKTVLEEATGYTKTRYNIVTLSLKQLIEQHKDFRDLLLFISLLNSQRIPRILLEKYKNEAIVDNFIYNLKKYSLITIKSAKAYSVPAISTHRSTQKISLDYLSKTLNLNKDNQLLQSIIDTLSNYMGHVIDREDFSNMSLLLTHGEEFLSHIRALLHNRITGSIEGELGCIHFYKGHLVKAKTFLEKGLVTLKKDTNKNPIRIARVLLYLGIVNRELGNYKQAKNDLEQSLRISLQHPVNNQAGIARTLTNLGIMERKLGNYEKAKNTLIQSLMMTKKRLSEEHLEFAWTLANLGVVDKELGNYKQAKEALEKSLTTYKKNFDENHSEIAWILLQLGVINRHLGNVASAKNYLEKALMSYEKYYGKNHIKAARVLRNLGLVYLLEDNMEYGESLILEALKIFQQDKHPESYVVLESLAELYLRKSMKAAAKGDIQQFQTLKKQSIDSLVRALEIVETHFLEDSPHKTRIQAKLKNLEQPGLKYAYKGCHQAGALAPTPYKPIEKGLAGMSRPVDLPHQGLLGRNAQERGISRQ